MTNKAKQNKKGGRGYRSEEKRKWPKIKRTRIIKIRIKIKKCIPESVGVGRRRDEGTFCRGRRRVPCTSATPGALRHKTGQSPPWSNAGPIRQLMFL